MRKPSSTRDVVLSIVGVVGFFLILTAGASSKQPWWNTLVALLVGSGLVELLVGLRALRRRAHRKAVGSLLFAGPAITVFVPVATSWRWHVAGAWPVALMVVAMIVSPADRSDESARPAS